MELVVLVKTWLKLGTGVVCATPPITALGMLNTGASHVYVVMKGKGDGFIENGFPGQMVVSLFKMVGVGFTVATKVKGLPGQPCAIGVTV
jgi:hypothetical protein